MQGYGFIKALLGYEINFEGGVKCEDNEIISYFDLKGYGIN